MYFEINFYIKIPYLDFYLYISMYIQAEYRRLGVIIFLLLFNIPVIYFFIVACCIITAAGGRGVFVYFRQTACISFIITAFHSLLIIILLSQPP